MLVSGQAGPLQGPVAVGQAIAAASRGPPGPRRQPPPAPPVPPLESTEIVDTTPKVVSTMSIPAPTSKAPQTAAPPPSLAEPPPLTAKPTKPSTWWMLLLIIPAIATGLTVVASQFLRERTSFKNFRSRWTNWQARLVGHLGLMEDNNTQWSRRASRPVWIDPTSPGSERPSGTGGSGRGRAMPPIGHGGSPPSGKTWSRRGRVDRRSRRRASNG